MEEAIKRFFSSYLKFTEKHRAICISMVVLFFIGTGFLASGLKLRSDLKELLPDKSPSILELDKMLSKVGGVSVLTVAVDSPNPEANMKFVDALNEKLSNLPKEDVRYVIGKVSAIKQFYEDNMLHFIDVDDLNKLYGRLRKLVDYEKFKQTPFYIDLGDDAPVTLNVDDIKADNSKNMKMPLAVYKDYYGGEQGRFLILMVRPRDASLSVDRARALIAEVKAVVDGLNPTSYDPEMKVGYCGNVVSTVEEYDTLKHDMVSTVGLCVLLVCVVIFLYFLRLRIIVFLGLTLFIGVIATFAFTRVAIGYLNSQTAFLASIIIGTGINYGIILLGRYLEERKAGIEPLPAMEEALTKAWLPTFLAAGTTAVAFTILIIAQVRGLSQFGVIGSVGVMLCWLSSVFVLPLMILSSEKVLTMFKKLSEPKRDSAVIEKVDSALSSFPVFIVIASLIVGIVSSVVVVKFIPNSLEYDFSKLRNKMSSVEGTEALERRVAKLWVGSMSPAVVMLDKPEDGPVLCDEVEKQNELRKDKDRMVDYCYNVYDLLPKNVEKRAPILKKFSALLSESWVNNVKGSMGKHLQRLKKSLQNKTIGIADLPEDLVRNFTDLDGNVGTFAYINPRSGMPLSDGKNLIKFADNVRDIELPDGRVFHATGTYMIFADLIQIVRDEAPLITIASLIAVALFVLLLTKKLKEAFPIIVTLVWGVVVMVACMSIFGLKINFFNFIALPLTFGVGVDYAINIALRLRESHNKKIVDLVKSSGTAVFVCSLTTIVGYYVLTLSTNQAVAQFGTVAIIGEFTTVFAAIFFLPSLVIVGRRLVQWRRGVKDNLVEPTTSGEQVNK